MGDLFVWLCTRWLAISRKKKAAHGLEISLIVVAAVACQSFVALNIWGQRLAEYLPQEAQALFALTFVTSTIGVVLATLATWPALALAGHVVAAWIGRQDQPFRNTLEAMGLSHVPLFWIGILQVLLSLWWPIAAAVPPQDVGEFLALASASRFTVVVGQLRLVGLLLSAWMFCAMLGQIFGGPRWRSVIAGVLPFVALTTLQWILRLQGGKVW